FRKPTTDRQQSTAKTIPRFARETLLPHHAQNPARVGDPGVAMQRLYVRILEPTISQVLLVNSTSASSFALAAPESNDCTATGMASAREPALPAATRAAAAFISTMSLRDDFLPSRTSRMICALA